MISISYDAFEDCSSLTSITVESGNVNYDSRDNCNAIIRKSDNTLIAGCKTTIIPSSVTSIGDYAFYGCSSLTSVTIPSSVTSIGSYAFSRCSGLTAITIPSSVTSIGSDAFDGCSGLTAITIPSSVTSIGSRAFANCSSLATISVETENPYFDSRDNCNAIIKKSNNTLIAGCKTTTIPNSVTSIGSFAFYFCSGLTDITIPSSVTSIASFSFDYCDNLAAVKLESTTPVTISQYSFSGCDNAVLYVPKGSKDVYLAADYWKDFKEIVEYQFDIIFDDANVKAVCVANWDTDGNGELSFSEAAAVTALGTVFKGKESISSFNELQHFTGIKFIGNSAFEGCSNLTSIIIPCNVTSIGSGAFNGCSNLTSIIIPCNVTSIGSGAFNGCSNLSVVKMENATPVSITENVFSNRTNTTLYVIFGSKAAYQVADYWKEFKEIVEYDVDITFEDIKVKALCIANWDSNGDGELSKSEAAAVTDLGTVFEWNSDIKTFNELQYFTGLTSIGNRAFYFCTGLTNITIPSSVTAIGDYAFASCSGLTAITIPSSVTSIGSFAFSGCSSLTSIIIPNSMTAIGDYAFASCSGLTSITIPSNVTHIGSFAFSGCSSLTTITIPSSVTSIGDLAFQDCSSLTDITIPSSVTSIGDGAFYGCSSLTDITIPSSVTSIGDGAFYGCSGLTSITVESGNVNYDSRDNCNAIIRKSDNTLIAGCKTTIIPSSVASIGDLAFYGCSGLTAITIPSSVTSIGDGAFSGCSGLTSITVESGNVNYDSRDNCNAIIRKLDNTLIAGCKNTIIPSSVTSIGSSAFYGCSGLTSVTIPSSVTSIGYSAFNSCSGLTSITIPNSVTSIGSSAFEDCTGLTAITIPSSVTSIGSWAFYGCSKLATVVVKNATPVGIDSYVFSNRKNATLYVPKGSKAAYEAADYWKEFKEIVEEKGGDYILGDVNGNGSVDIGDAVSIVNYLVGKESAVFVEAAADTNKNGGVDIGDAVTIVNFLVGKTTSLSRIIDNVWDEREPQ